MATLGGTPSVSCPNQELGTQNETCPFFHHGNRYERWLAANKANKNLEGV